MKLLHYIFGMMILASVSFAQVKPPFEVTYHQENGGSTLTLGWKQIPADSGAVSYTVSRLIWYFNIITNKPDTTEFRRTIKENLRDNTYSDQNISSCFHYTYWITTKIISKLNVITEGPSSAAVSPIIGDGANAVVIYPTPDVSAVTGSPITINIQACDGKSGAHLKYSLGAEALGAGLGINQDGVIQADSLLAKAGVRLIPVTVYVSDEKVSSSATFNIRVAPPSLANIMGGIHFGNGVPFTVALTLNDISVNDNSHSTKSDASGHFGFAGVALGTYRLSYTAPELGNITHWYKDNFISQDSATLIVVNEAHVVELQPITLVRPEPRKGVNLTGRVRRVNDGGENIFVQAYEVSAFLRRRTNPHPSAPRVTAGASALVASDGSYSLSLDTGSTYVLLASASGYQSHFIGAESNCSSPYCAQTFSPSGDTAISDSYIAPSDTSGQQISGNVSSLANASTGVRAMILLTSTNQGTITSGYSGGLVPFETVTSDDAGNFTINSVARDTTGQTKYLIQAVPFQDYVPAYFAANDSVWNTMLWEHAQLFSVDTVKKDPLLINIHVQPMTNGTATINGHVVEVSQEVEATSVNTYVYAVDQTSMTTAGYALTDGSGNYAITNLPAGTYAIFADKISYHFGSASGISILSSDTGSRTMPLLKLTRSIVGIGSEALLPMLDQISSAYPNPFSDATMFHVDAVAGATLKVYDILGRECADLSPQLRSGSGFVIFRADRFLAGTYLVKLRDQHGISSRPLMIVR